MSSESTRCTCGAMGTQVHVLEIYWYFGQLIHLHACYTHHVDGYLQSGARNHELVAHMEIVLRACVSFNMFDNRKLVSGIEIQPQIMIRFHKHKSRYVSSLHNCQGDTSSDDDY